MAGPPTDVGNVLAAGHFSTIHWASMNWECIFQKEELEL
jgi:hypothetical protein